MMNNHIATTCMPNMNSQMMLDNFKSMMLTMAMVKGSSQTDSKNSFMNTLLHRPKRKMRQKHNYYLYIL